MKYYQLCQTEVSPTYILIGLPYKYRKYSTKFKGILLYSINGLKIETWISGQYISIYISQYWMWLWGWKKELRNNSENSKSITLVNSKRILSLKRSNIIHFGWLIPDPTFVEISQHCQVFIFSKFQHFFYLSYRK